MIQEKIKRKEIIPIGYDRVFKKVFGDNEAIERVEAFISIYLNIPIEELKGNIIILNEEQRVASQKSKRSTLDILAEIKANDSKKKINIELNYFHKNIRRNIIYVCNIASSSIKNKEAYEKIPKILQINFDKYEIDEKNPRIVKRYYLKNEINNILDDVLEIDHVNIVKCYKAWYNHCIERESKQDQEIIKLGALLYIRNMEELEKCLEGIEMEENIKDEIMEAVDRYIDDEYERLFYDAEEDRRMIENDEKIIARREGHAEGHAEGLAEGLAEGRVEGRAEGKAEGLTEGRSIGFKEGKHKEQLLIAKNLLKKKYPIKEIMEITNLSKKELEKLK